MMGGARPDGPDIVTQALPDVSRETLARLEALVALLVRWQRIKNLVAPSTLDTVWQRHVLDSLQIVRLAPKARRWIDLGSGAGFPGIVVATSLAEADGAAIHLVEANGRKSAFLRTAARELGLPVTVHPARIEDVAGRLEPAFDVVTARALASLPKLLALMQPLMRPHTQALLHKGADFEAEVAEARTGFAFDLVEHESLSDPAARILQIGGIVPLSADRNRS
ncbi:16S rRNA (guanine(527)-N(7))-methyltransferase RsmG [Amorphus coralli]|uniref:16S rRNA (guanine(527)-N(7))-methyltransferase RsmG n=1 Tax=Amorphus coralli TaxID=340680 RepID=UPI000380A30B|nr:16S rRNA (guanine(527)-N(7))-methyltransferase RsmG [Amorphus coralli]